MHDECDHHAKYSLQWNLGLKLMARGKMFGRLLDKNPTINHPLARLYPDANEPLPSLLEHPRFQPNLEEWFEYHRGFSLLLQY